MVDRKMILFFVHVCYNSNINIPKIPNSIPYYILHTKSNINYILIMQKKVDSRIQTLVNNSLASNQRSIIFIVGDRARYQVTLPPHRFSTSTPCSPTRKLGTSQTYSGATKRNSASQHTRRSASKKSSPCRPKASTTKPMTVLSNSSLPTRISQSPTTKKHTRSSETLTKCSFSRTSKPSLPMSSAEPSRLWKEEVSYS